MFPEPARRTLLYRESPANGGIVFAQPDRAAYVARIHHAIETARTWGELRDLMPPEEYRGIVLMRMEEVDEPPEASEPFTGYDVPGYSDGDYPPWLQQEINQVLPIEVLDSVGSRKTTALNGDYFHIDKERLSETLERLRALGFEVNDGNYLGTWY